MNKMLLSSLNSYFNAEKINISSEELELQLFSNPHTASLFAISETLDFLKVDNVAAKVDTGQLENLPTDFIAFIEEKGETPYFAHIRQNGTHVYFNAEKRKLSKERFKEIWNGVVLLAERNESTTNQKGRVNKYIGLALVLFFGLLFWNDIPVLLFSIIGLFGLYTSKEIFVTSNDRASFLSDKVCGKKDGEGCDKVIKSKKYDFKGFAPNDLLFAFFTTGVVHVAIYQKVTYAIAVVYALGLLAVLLSIVAQGLVLKAWCRLCLLSSGLLVVQTALLSISLSNFAAWGSNFFSFIEPIHLLSYFLVFAIALFGIFEYRKTKTDNYRLIASEIELLKFKRSPKIVRYILKDAETIAEPYSHSGLYFGNPDSSHTVTLIFSLTCSYCAKAFKQFFRTYHKYSKSLKFQLIFNHYDVAHSKNNDVAASIIQSHTKEMPLNVLHKLEHWFEISNPDLFFKREKKELRAQGYDVLSQQREWCSKNGIFQTPVMVINESIIPHYYDAGFLDDFIDALQEEIHQTPSNQPA